MRTFDTGAVRDVDSHKLDYEGHLSPLAIEAYTRYLSAKRTLPDGTLRAADNWQLGFGATSWMQSFIRHAMQLWLLHRGWPAYETRPDGTKIPVTKREALCAILFNIFGQLHELVIAEDLTDEKEAQAQVEKGQEVLAEAERGPRTEPDGLRGESQTVEPCLSAASPLKATRKCVLTKNHKGPCATG